MLFLIKIVSIMYHIFSVSPAELLNEGRDLLRRFRGVRVLDHHDLLVTNTVNKWGKGPSQINGNTVCYDIAGEKKRNDTKARDTELMKAFINNSQLNMAIFPGLLGRKQYIPGGVPLIDVVRAHLQKEDTWKFPPPATLENWSESRGMGMSMTNTVEVREIVVGVTTHEEIKDITDWALQKWKASEDSLPTGVLPIQVRDIPMTMHDKMRIGRPELHGKFFKLEVSPGKPKESQESWFTTSQGEYMENRWARFPAKVSLGNGLDWTLVISFNFLIDGKKKYVKPSLIPAPLMEFLRNIPPLIGFPARDDIVMVENTISIIQTELFRFPMFIDLASMAVLSGWKMHCRSRVAFALVILGTPLNRLSIRGDGLWILKYAEIPQPLQIFMLMDLKFVYIAYSTLLIALREETLPDPDIYCYLTDSTQWQVLRWWSELVIRTLGGVYVSSSALKTANTRSEVLAALRARNPAGDLQSQSPYRVKIFAKLVEGGITLYRGGCRFLHIERERAVLQYLYAVHLPIGSYQAMFQGDISEDKLLYARFGQYRIRNLDSWRPVPIGSHSRYMTFLWVMSPWIYQTCQLIIS